MLPLLDASRQELNTSSSCHSFKVSHGTTFIPCLIGFFRSIALEVKRTHKNEPTAA